MEALDQANECHAIAYGSDPYTKEAEDKIRTMFGGEAETLE